MLPASPPQKVKHSSSDAYIHVPPYCRTTCCALSRCPRTPFPPPPPLGRTKRRDSYATYLSSHGGSSNAYTDTEDTVYFFDVGSDYLKGALDRFAQFFIAPQVDRSKEILLFVPICSCLLFFVLYFFFLFFYDFLCSGFFFCTICASICVLAKASFRRWPFLSLCSV